MTVEVRPARTRRERRAFLEFPWRVYQGDPLWTPPLLPQLVERLDPAHNPVIADGLCEIFVAWRGGEPVGTVVAAEDTTRNADWAEDNALFGFFECTDDDEAAGRLFDAARGWLEAEGLPTIRGPVSPSLNYECGLLVEGFDSPPTFMITYNPPYYERMVEAYGFRTSQNLYSFIGHIEMLKSLDEKLEFVVHEATRRFDIKLRRLDRARFMDEVRMFLDIYNRSLGATWGFTPLSEAETEHMAHALKWLIVPEMTAIAEVEGKPVAAVFGLLDYNPRIKKINGRLFPLGVFRLLWNRRAIKRVRLMSTNVVPEFQRWGLGLVAMAHLVPEALKWGIEEGEFSWVLESNHLSYATLKRGGALLDKKFRIYDYGPNA